MSLDPRIILAGTQPDFVNVLARSNEAAQQKNEFQRTNALNSLYQEQGPQIAAGDQNALNALAGFDPKAALGVQSARQNMRINEEELSLRKQSAARESAKWAQTQDDRTKAEQAQKMRQGLMAAGSAFEAGDQAGLDRILQGYGVEPVPLAEFPYLAAQVEGALEGLSAAGQFSKPPAPKWKVTDSGQAINELDPLAGAQDIPNFEANPKTSAAEQKIERIISEYGVDRRTAVGIVDGVLNVSRHPLDGSVVVTDLATNQVVTPQQAEPTPPPGGLPERTNSFEGTNPRGAVGLPGVAASLANTILDSVGLGQAAPDIDRAQTAMDSLATRTVQGLSAQWPGRPSNLTREMIDNMTVRPGDFTTGPGRAANKVADMKREIERAIASAHEVASSQGKYSKTQIAEAQAALNDLLPLYQDYIDLGSALGGHAGAGEGQTKSGIKWSVE
ncbi:hypothetical protein K3759_09625 [Sulfitobacter sp. W027]|uniref:hypothetical protein n=1 Tax=Sulfitobacter sp. W027 TaxID=2867025 RepID=UPI0021A4748E|nr:hypothetical protein [Sulfitobacter sp. W027]UWR32227.1 hypothetical protein K3759_09625 [Sulfitobacter sp. W027]